MLKRILWLRNRYQSYRATLLSSVSHDTSSRANFLNRLYFNRQQASNGSSPVESHLFYSLRLSSSALRVLLPAWIGFTSTWVHFVLDEIACDFLKCFICLASKTTATTLS